MSRLLLRSLRSSNAGLFLLQNNYKKQGIHVPVPVLLRYISSAITQKFESLNRDSSEFLRQEEKLDSKRKTHEITRLIQQWSSLWGKESASSDSNFFRDNGDAHALEKGVEVVDRLANVLLDVREANIKNSSEGDDHDRTNYLNTLNLALAFWGKSPPSEMNGVRAQHLLSRMEHVGVLDFSEIGADSGQLRCIMIAYGAAIQAWAISHDPPNSSVNGALQAQALLEKLEQVEGGTDIQPQLRIYNSSMHGFAIRGMVEEAEQLLEKLEKLSETNAELTPDVLTFSSCINAYLKSTKRGIAKGEPVAKRAEALLDRMVKRYESTGGDLQYRPNQTTFGTVISLFAKSNTKTAAEDADRILQWLISLYEKDVNSGKVRNEKNNSYSLQPSYVHFISVLIAYQKRSMGRGAAVQRIEELLVQMDAMCQAGNDKVTPTYQVRTCKKRSSILTRI